MIMEEVSVLGLSNSHPNVVDCFDCCITDKAVWLVMESIYIYMYGGSLNNVVCFHQGLAEEFVGEKQFHLILPF